MFNLLNPNHRAPQYLLLWGFFLFKIEALNNLYAISFLYAGDLQSSDSRAQALPAAHKGDKFGYNKNLNMISSR